MPDLWRPSTHLGLLRNLSSYILEHFVLNKFFFKILPYYISNELHRSRKVNAWVFQTWVSKSCESSVPIDSSHNVTNSLQKHSTLLTLKKKYVLWEPIHKINLHKYIHHLLPISMHLWTGPNNPDDKWKYISAESFLGNQWESQQVFNLRVGGGDSLLAWLVALFC